MKREKMELKQKVVLITGASEGIGLATTHLLAKAGAKLALAARSAEKLERVASSLPDAIAIPTDLRNEEAVKQMVAQTHQHFGRLDILINNAGQGMHVPIEQANLQHFRSVFELNVVSVLAAMQAVIPIMRVQGGGMIVNVSTGFSKTIVPGVGPYASTKYALNALTLTARQELAEDRIRVGLVHPGMTRTNFHQHLPEAKNEHESKSKSGATPRGGAPMMIETAEQVAATILEAVETEAVETYTNNLKPFLLPSSFEPDGKR
jgi:NAD(P)-dependent dehydrogenase (short-subunit alcohol dehydrogenase family)